ncbi:MAG: 3-deoxy-manno-octulosonate cytidylyltransferase [Rhodoferax sp.]|nr:MAG: 3-deoxy-manno-octulosonate cytidylyltransferase [Rhodoferax sp.]
MSYTVLIPARLTSSRLPNKPLAMIGGLPMVVRVAKQLDSLANTGIQVVVAGDDPEIIDTCARHGIQAILTHKDHASGTDRLAEACEKLHLANDSIVVNVQGDEPLIQAGLVNEVAKLLLNDPGACMSTAAHPLDALDDFINPNVVKVVLNRNDQAMYFSRAPIPWWRDGNTAGIRTLPQGQAPLRHIGIYAYRAGFLRLFPQLPPSPLEQVEALEQLRALWNGFAIAVHITLSAPGTGVDTPDDLERVRKIVESGVSVSQ